MKENHSHFMSMVCQASCCATKFSCCTQVSILIALLVFTMTYHPANIYGNCCIMTSILILWLGNIVAIDVISEIMTGKANHRSFLDKIFDKKILSLLMTEFVYMIAVLWLPHITYHLIIHSVALNTVNPDLTSLIAFAVIFGTAAVAIYIKITYAFAIPATVMEEKEVFDLARKLSKNFQLQILAAHIFTLLSLSICVYLNRTFISPNLGVDFYSNLAHQALICAVLIAHAIFLGTMITKLYKKASS